MKEAAGEANLTVVAIILIAVVVAVATPLVNSLMKSVSARSCCTDAGGVVDGNKCFAIKSDGTRGSSVDYNTLVATNGNCKTVIISKTTGTITVK